MSAFFPHFHPSLSISSHLLFISERLEERDEVAHEMNDDDVYEDLSFLYLNLFPLMYYHTLNSFSPQGCKYAEEDGRECDLGGL